MTTEAQTLALATTSKLVAKYATTDGGVVRWSRWAFSDIHTALNALPLLLAAFRASSQEGRRPDASAMSIAIAAVMAILGPGAWGAYAPSEQRRITRAIAAAMRPALPHSEGATNNSLLPPIAPEETAVKS